MPSHLQSTFLHSLPEHAGLASEFMQGDVSMAAGMGPDLVFATFRALPS